MRRIVPRPILISKLLKAPWIECNPNLGSGGPSAPQVAQCQQGYEVSRADVAPEMSISAPPVLDAIATALLGIQSGLARATPLFRFPLPALRVCDVQHH